MYFQVALLLLILFTRESWTQMCELSKNVRKCGLTKPAKEIQVKYFYQEGTYTCLAFKFHPKCGHTIDNKKIFNSRLQCTKSNERLCAGEMMANYSLTCWGGDGGGGVGALINKPGTSCEEAGPGACPKGAICVNESPFGARWSCCNTTLLALHGSQNKKTCSNAAKVWLGNDGAQKPHVAETCDHLVCPSGYQCKQENVLFAKCCEISKKT